MYVSYFKNHYIDPSKFFFLLGFGVWGRIIIIKREKMYELDSAVAE